MNGSNMNELLWKPDWAEARRAMQAWWEHKGLALCVRAPRDEPIADIPLPDPNVDPETKWLNIDYWTQNYLAIMARSFYGGVAAPTFETFVGGPGSLGLFLGCEGHLSPTTVWYSPSITDPERHPPLRFDQSNVWWQRHVALIERALRESRGRFLVAYPDLIENIDTLAQLRDPQTLLVDLVERPEWVKEKVFEINQAFFESFDALWPLLRDPWGGSMFAAFSIWGPGKRRKCSAIFRA
jgi:hypothetical protein